MRFKMPILNTPCYLELDPSSLTPAPEAISRAAMSDRLDTYSGDEPYVFICYSHEDSEAVYRQLSILQDRGLRLWYDQGISPGTRWSDELANSLYGASVVFFFCTESAVQSPHCQDEVAFALEEGIPIVVIREEATILPPGLRLRLGAQQALLIDNLSAGAITDRLLQTAQSAVAGDSSNQDVPPARNGRPIGMMAAGLVVIIMLMAVGYWLNLESADPASAQAEDNAVDSASVRPDSPSTPQPSESRSPQPTVVIMPLRVIGDESRTTTLAAGLEQDIAAMLMGPELESLRMKDVQTEAGLDVTPSHAVPSSITTPEDALRSFDSEYAISGSVQIAGETARVTLQLTFAEEERTTWTHSYRYPAADLLKLQSDIALHCASSVINEIALRRYAWTMKPSMPDAAWLPYLSARKLEYKVSAGEYVPPGEALSYWQQYFDVTGDYLQITPVYQAVYFSRIQSASDVTDFAALTTALEPLVTKKYPHIFFNQFARMLQAVNALIALEPDEYHRFMQDVPRDAMIREITEIPFAVYSGDSRMLRDAARGRAPIVYLTALTSLGQYDLGLTAVPDALTTLFGTHGRARVRALQAIMLHMTDKKAAAREVLEAAFQSYGAASPDAFPVAFAVTGQMDRARALLETMEQTGYMERLSVGEYIQVHLLLSEPEVVFDIMDRAIQTRHVMGLGVLKLHDQAGPDSWGNQFGRARETRSRPEWQQRMQQIYSMTPAASR
jgi:TolB-like protein